MVQQDDIAKARDSIIEIGVKAFVEQGMTQEKARERVEKAMNAPLRFDLPSIEDL